MKKFQYVREVRMITSDLNFFLNPDHEYLKKENNSEWGGDAAWEALSFSLGSMS